MEWTYEHIRQWAPNNLLLQKSRRIARPAAWKEISTDGKLLWGRFSRGEDQDLISVVRLDGEKARCECNERYQPCRHALALPQLMLRYATFVKQAEAAPPWVQEVLQRPMPARPNAAEEARRKAAREERLGKRQEDMEQGVEELEQWLLDLVRQGLTNLESQPNSFWERAAAKMVDRKLGGIARRIRSVPDILQQPGWPDYLPGLIAELYLFVQGFRQMSTLSEPLQEELLSLGGVNQKKEALLEQEGIRDHWLVVGQEEGEEERLRYRRTWLLGEHTGRFALLLDFAWGRETFTFQYVAGSALRGELVFYPGAYPLRALMKEAAPYQQPLEAIQGYATFADMLDAYAEGLSANPWIFAFPALLEAVHPGQDSEGRFVLVDSEQRQLPLYTEEGTPWKLLAVAAGESLSVFGTWSGQAFRPQSAFYQERLVLLSGPVDSGLEDGQDW